MKTIVQVFAAFAIVIATTLFASPVDNFTATNNYNGVVGSVTINTTLGSYNLNIPTTGQHQTGISGNVVNISINGSTIPVNTNAIVRLPNNDTIRITWTAPNVVVIDLDEIAGM